VQLRGDVTKVTEATWDLIPLVEFRPIVRPSQSNTTRGALSLRKDTDTVSHPRRPTHSKTSRGPHTDEIPSLDNQAHQPAVLTTLRSAAARVHARRVPPTSRPPAERVAVGTTERHVAAEVKERRVRFLGETSSDVNRWDLKTVGMSNHTDGWTPWTEESIDVVNPPAHVVHHPQHVVSSEGHVKRLLPLLPANSLPSSARSSSNALASEHKGAGGTAATAAPAPAALPPVVKLAWVDSTPPSASAVGESDLRGASSVPRRQPHRTRHHPDSITTSAVSTKHVSSSSRSSRSRGSRKPGAEITNVAPSSSSSSSRSLSLLVSGQGLSSPTPPTHVGREGLRSSVPGPSAYVDNVDVAASQTNIAASSSSSSAIRWHGAEIQVGAGSSAAWW
jgi:hypothetical protein